MKKSFALMMAAPLALASCGLLGLPNGDVTGSINGTTPTGKGEIRLALGGVTVAGIANTGPDQIALDTFNPSKKVYSISLPSGAASGAYDVFAYADTNKDGKWTVGEPRTSSGKSLIYSAAGLGKKDGSNLLNLKAGWSLVQGLNILKSGAPFSHYDLSW